MINVKVNSWAQLRFDFWYLWFTLRKHPNQIFRKLRDKFRAYRYSLLNRSCRRCGKTRGKNFWAYELCSDCSRYRLISALRDFGKVAATLEDHNLGVAYERIMSKLNPDA